MECNVYGREGAYSAFQTEASFSTKQFLKENFGSFIPDEQGRQIVVPPEVVKKTFPIWRKLHYVSTASKDEDISTIWHNLTLMSLWLLRNEKELDKKCSGIHVASVCLYLLLDKHMTEKLSEPELLFGFCRDWLTEHSDVIYRWREENSFTSTGKAVNELKIQVLKLF